MIEELFKRGYVNYERIIIDNTKTLGINTDEAVVLIHLLKEYQECGHISPSKLSDVLLMTSNKIDKTIASLMERGFYEIYITYDNGIGNECISFQPLFKKIEAILMKKESIDKYDIAKANQYISNKMNRVLTASELEILQCLMIEDHYTYDEIVVAVDDLVERKRVISLRMLTQTLANKRVEPKPKKEAPKSLKDFYSQI